MVSLGYLMFPKKKRNGIIKGSECADGRPHRAYKLKEETSSPTAYVESIFIKSVVKVYEHQDIAVVDIPGAFLQKKASDSTIIKLQGAIVEALLKINPMWSQYIVHEGKNRTPTIYSKAIKALYETVDASKLFFDDLSSFFTELGFTPNPYDACVVNKNIDGT